MSLRNLIRRMSLTHRLLALTLVASLPGMIALIYNALDLRNTRYSEVRADAFRRTQAVVAELDQVFDGLQGAMRAVSEAEEVHEANNTVCTDYLVRVRANIAPVTAIPRGQSRRQHPLHQRAGRGPSQSRPPRLFPRRRG